MSEPLREMVREWDSLPNDIRSEMILRCPRLYFAMARVARREQQQTPLRLREYWCCNCGLRASGRSHCADALNLGDPETWQGRRCPRRLTGAER